MINYNRLAKQCVQEVFDSEGNRSAQLNIAELFRVIPDVHKNPNGSDSNEIPLYMDARASLDAFRVELEDQLKRKA